MARVEIAPKLKEQIMKKFKQESITIFKQLKSLGENPNKGKIVGNIKEILLKEIKYLKFRFYFITDGRVLKFGTKSELEMLIIIFLAMSEKKDQKKIIKEILDKLKET